MGESLKVGVGRPRITVYGQMSEAVQIAVSDFISGNKDVETSLNDAAQAVESIMEDAGYYE